MKRAAIILMFSFLALSQTGCTVLKNAKILQINNRSVILTFDDSPNPYFDTTKQLLDVLDKHKVKAYFCIVGRYAEENPELIKLIHNGGHILVNHSYKHDNLALKSYSQISDDLDKCDKAIAAALNDPNFRTHFVRPPYGLVTEPLKRYCNENDKVLLPVTHIPVDFLFGPNGKNNIVNTIVSDVKRQNGGIIVLHDRIYTEKWAEKMFTKKDSSFDRTWIPDATEEIIIKLRKEGFEFTTYSPAKNQ